MAHPCDAFLFQEERTAYPRTGIRIILCHETRAQLLIRRRHFLFQQIEQLLCRMCHGQIQLGRIKITAAFLHIFLMIITKQRDRPASAQKIKDDAGIITHQHIGSTQHIIRLPLRRERPDMTETAEIDAASGQPVQLAQHQRIVIKTRVDLFQQLLQQPDLLIAAHRDDLAPPRRHIGNDPFPRTIQSLPHPFAAFRLKESRIARITAKQHLSLKQRIQLIRSADTLPCVRIGHDKHITEQKPALLVGRHIRVFHKIKAQCLQGRAMPCADTLLIRPLAQQRMECHIADEIFRAGKRFKICRRLPDHKPLGSDSMLCAALPHPFLILWQTSDLQPQ